MAPRVSPGPLAYRWNRLNRQWRIYALAWRPTIPLESEPFLQIEVSQTWEIPASPGLNLLRGGTPRRRRSQEARCFHFC